MEPTSEMRLAAMEKRIHELEANVSNLSQFVASQDEKINEQDTLIRLMATNQKGHTRLLKILTVKIAELSGDAEMTERAKNISVT